MWVVCLFSIVRACDRQRRFDHSTKDTAANGKLPVKDEKQLPCQVTRGHWQMIPQADQGWAKIGS
jgi:hypothetical protein